MCKLQQNCCSSLGILQSSLDVSLKANSQNCCVLLFVCLVLGHQMVLVVLVILGVACAAISVTIISCQQNISG